MANDGIHSARYQAARAAARAEWKRKKRRCHICLQEIDYDAPVTDPDHFQLDHIRSRSRFPQLENDPTNWAPSHASCNKHKHDGELNADIGVTSEAW